MGMMSGIVGDGPFELQMREFNKYTRRRILVEEKEQAANQFESALDSSAIYSHVMSKTTEGQEARRILTLPGPYNASNKPVSVYTKTIRVHINSIMEDQVKLFRLGWALSTYGADMPDEIKNALMQTKKVCGGIGFPQNIVFEGNKGFDGKNNNISCALKGKPSTQFGTDSLKEGTLDIFLKS